MGGEIRCITQPEFNKDFSGENMKDTDREVEKRATLAGFAALGGEVGRCTGPDLAESGHKLNICGMK